MRREHLQHRLLAFPEGIGGLMALFCWPGKTGDARAMPVLNALRARSGPLGFKFLGSQQALLVCRTVLSGHESKQHPDETHKLNGPKRRSHQNIPAARAAQVRQTSGSFFSFRSQRHVL